MTPKLVIFDMDGLMIDSERISYQCFTAVCAERGLAFDYANFREIVGYGEEDNIHTLNKNYPEQDGEELFFAVERRYHESVLSGDVSLKPGLLELLDAIEKKGTVKKVVATSTVKRLANRILESKGLSGRFDGTIFGDMVKHKKPAPDIYLMCSEKFETEPKDCLALEDSVPGVEAALAAGMPVVMIPDMVKPDPSIAQKCAAVCDTLADVIGLI